MRSLTESLFGLLALFVVGYFFNTLLQATLIPYAHSFFLNKTQGVVQAVTIDNDRISGTTADGIPYSGNSYYKPKLTFKYLVEGEELVGERFALFGKSYETLQSAQVAISGYKPGQNITVWYSSLNSRYAVVDPSISYVKATVGLVVITLAGLLIWKMFTLNRKPSGFWRDHF